MLELEEIRRRLMDRRLNIVGKATGFHPTTIAYIRDGRQTNPTLKVMKKLSDYLGGSNGGLN